MKKSLSVVLLLVLMLSLFGCRQAVPNEAPDDEQQTVVIVIPKSPAAIPLLRMAETNALGDKVDLKLEIYTDMEKMMVLATEYNYSYLIVPVHTAAILYNKEFDLKLMNVFLWGGMHLSTTDPDFKSWDDLVDKELFVPSKGSVPDMITQFFLREHNLQIGQNVNVVYSNHTEISQLIKSKRAKYAIDAEPFVTANKENIKNYRSISDYSEKWQEAVGQEYNMPSFGVVANGTYVGENKEQVSEFSQQLEQAIAWVIENPSEAGSLAQKYLNANSELIEKAVPNFSFDYQQAQDIKPDVEKYYSILASFKPESIGGKLPDEEFYYQ